MTGSSLGRTSCLFVDGAPPCLYRTSPDDPLIRSDIAELSSVPVLRRIGLFQENSAIKRVSKLV